MTVTDLGEAEASDPRDVAVGHTEGVYVNARGYPVPTKGGQHLAFSHCTTPLGEQATIQHALKTTEVHSLCRTSQVPANLFFFDYNYNQTSQSIIFGEIRDTQEGYRIYPRQYSISQWVAEIRRIYDANGKSPLHLITKGV